MKAYTIFMACIAVLLISCGKGDRQNEHNRADIANVQLKEIEKSEDKIAVAKDAAADTTTVSGNTVALQAGTPAMVDWDKKIIKTANVKIELKDYTAFNNNIHKGLKAYGAYIGAENQNSSDEKTENTITIKVPVDQFENLMNTFTGTDIRVLEKNITTEDVTGEVVDTKSRLAARKQVRERYLDLLKQAKNMKDILAVEAEVNSIQEEIESADGRVNYLVHQSAYSTIHLNYFQYLNGTPVKETEPSFFTKINEAFKEGGAVIVNLVLFFISIWPLVIGGVLLVMYFRKWRVKKA